ncbi:hypothetical protein [Mucilaginibacter sp.]|uniref:hypothetical protein n=1 Tax=Mucilaginibacter sp. TaxID=1882438 RepID=UPI00261FB027|nr:hypothetical protein [Mucilaginibacter sp.]MDB5031055.1 hypothetical protein [Mucilaginibacter sp.]
MTFKKKNFLGKLLLKYSDRDKYKEYKWEITNYNKEEFQNYFIGKQRLNTVEKIKAFCASSPQLNVHHSGNAGDIIYALATLKEIHELTGVKINLYLKLSKPRNMPKHMTHPLGSVMLNQKMVDMLAPLVLSQKYMDKCEAYNGEQIHIDLDFFRSKLIPIDHGNIARWCGYLTGVTPQLWKSWLTVDADKAYANTIVIARSERYRNTAINYSFLQDYKDVVFIGVASEYEDMRKSIPNLKWVQVDDFLKLARIIAGCKVFIGNQSFPFSIAEGLKVPRILELYYQIANVIPEGENAHDFFFQEHLESLVKQLAV